MQGHHRLTPLPQLLEEDLAAVAADLAEEFSRMSGCRLLITGGGGFLGYYLVQSALHWNRKHAKAPAIDVTVYDNYLLGVPGWLEALQREPHLTLLRQDMSQPLPHDMGHFDYIVHAAGIASPSFYRAQPLKCIDANIIGLRQLLDYAVAQANAGQPLKGLLFFSSSEIYGDPPASEIPTPETYRGNVSCTGPRACYDEAKRFGETLCVTFARAYGVSVKIARPFNNYGPGLKLSDGRVIADFARDILAGRDIVMLSDGCPTRTFCYATDAITGYYKVLVRGAIGESYNIGIERPEVLITQLAHYATSAAAELFGYRGKVRLGKPAESDYLVDNPNRRCPAIDKARTQLGFQPRVLIPDGIRRALIWYHHHRIAADASRAA